MFNAKYNISETNFKNIIFRLISRFKAVSKEYHLFEYTADR